ncbi:MAG TPA: rod shape-determining protein MreD [Acidimicrobiia bacterium]|nr:rod shape-determining protein MreD [Acidimicrobiia bacterium]
MKIRHAVVMVIVVILAVALQTTLFIRLRPFDAAPALVLLVVVAYARYLLAEYALLIGFFAGLFQDLLAETPLGLWALVMTVVAFSVLRFRDRFEDDFGLIGPFVLVLTIGGLALFSVLGTIFGEKTLADVGILKKIALPAVYNVVIAPLILRIAPLTLGVTRSRDTAFTL